MLSPKMRWQTSSTKYFSRKKRYNHLKYEVLDVCTWISIEKDILIGLWKPPSNFSNMIGKKWYEVLDVWSVDTLVYLISYAMLKKKHIYLIYLMWHEIHVRIYCTELIIELKISFNLRKLKTYKIKIKFQLVWENKDNNYSYQCTKVKLRFQTPSIYEIYTQDT